MRKRAHHSKRAEDLQRIDRAIESLIRLNASRRVHSQRMSAAGAFVSQPGLALLRRVEERGPLPLGDLAHLTHMDPSAVGRQVRQLEDQHLISREQDAEDGRVTLVSVTHAGRALCSRVSEVLYRHLEDVLSGWPASDRRELGRLLTRLVEDLRAVRYRGSDGEGPPEDGKAASA